MVLKLLLNTRMIWMIFIKTLNNIILIKNGKNGKNPIVTEFFTRGRKLNISLVFIAQSYIAVPKNIRLNFTHHLILKILNKQ